jgi:hypothetical protein
MWSANETSNDLLGFQVHVDLVRSVVTDDKMLPVTIGVVCFYGYDAILDLYPASFTKNTF